MEQLKDMQSAFMDQWGHALNIEGCVRAVDDISQIAAGNIINKP
jgi:hypothetical protein